MLSKLHAVVDQCACAMKRTNQVGRVKEIDALFYQKLYKEIGKHEPQIDPPSTTRHLSQQKWCACVPKAHARLWYTT